MTNIVCFILFLLCLFCLFYIAGKKSGKRVKHQWFCVWQSYHARTLINGTIEIGCDIKIINAKTKEEAIGRFVEITKDNKVEKRLEILCDQLKFIE